jgi:cyclophilin family peptidyl-prolyl cis-trans isomerase
MSSVRTIVILGILVAALLFAGGCTNQQPQDSCSGSSTCPLPTTPGSTTGDAATTGATAPASADSGRQVRLETSMGDIVIALDPNMPVTAGNFEKLVASGYYDGVIFHRVIDGFMIQGGDPTGTGRGGPGYTIRDEFTSTNRNDRGTISMANAGPNTGGSQFFINLVDNNRLDAKHPVFGTVVEGMDVVDAIGRVPTGAGDRPIRNVTIIRAMLV